MREGGGGSLRAVSKVESSALAPHPPRFILLESFSVGTFLVVFDFRHSL